MLAATLMLIEPGRAIWDGHVHSCYSPDSDSDLASIGTTAKQRGLSLVVLADHLYLPEHLLRLEERDRALEEHRGAVELIPGVEISLETDLGMRCLEQRDRFSWQWVIGAVHGFPKENLYPEYDNDDQPARHYATRLRQAGEAYLARIYLQRSVEAMACGCLDVLTHPLDVFIYAGVPFIELEEVADELVVAAARYGVMMELNNHALDLQLLAGRNGDNADGWLRILGRLFDGCQRQGVPLTVSSDAHKAESVGDFRHVESIRKHLGIPMSAFQLSWANDRPRRPKRP